MSFNLSKCMPKLKCYQGLTRFYSVDEPSPYERDEKGPQIKVIHGQEYPSWKTSIIKGVGHKPSAFSLFNSDAPNPVPIFIRMKRYPVHTWPSIVKQMILQNKEDSEILSQTFSNARVSTLGWDLAAATFICYRGGAVKFVEGKEWIKMCKDVKMEDKLPTYPSPGLLLESIDCEGFILSGLRYEGLLNLQNLDYLKWLSLKGNSLIDDWCLDRLSGMMSSKSVEYLDLRGCSVTHRGIQVLHRMPTLKLLILDSKTNDEELDLTCAMLQEIMPDLLVKFD